MGKRIAVLIICSLLIVSAALALTACKGDAGSMPNTVKEFTSSKQTSGGTTVVNYQTIVKADANWDKMSSKDRQKIIDYAFNQAKQQASDNGVTSYNVMGKGEATDSQTSPILFMYDKDNNQVIIYVDGEVSDRVAPPGE